MKPDTVFNTKNAWLRSNVSFASTSAVEVPIGNQAAVDALMEGNEDIKEFTNFMKLGEDHLAFPYGPEFPAVMTKEWAESYAKAVNATPGPLYLRGHEDEGAGKTRPIPFGYVVGAAVLKNSSGEDVLAIRNYFKKAESSTSQEELSQTIKEMRAGMLSTSIGNLQKNKIEWLDTPSEEGYLARVTAVESVTAQSNAIVEFNQTGSEADIVSANFKAGLTLPENKHKGNNMDFKEMMASLKNGISIGTLSPEELGTGLGVTILTTDQRASLKRLEDAEATLGMTVDKYVAKVKETETSSFASLKEAALTATFKTPEVKEVAEGLFSLETGSKEDIDKEIERLTNLSALKKMQGMFASQGNTNFGTEVPAPGSGNPSTPQENSEYGQRMEG